MSKTSPRTVARVALGGMLVAAGISHLTVARKGFRAQVPDWGAAAGLRRRCGTHAQVPAAALTEERSVEPSVVVATVAEVVPTTDEPVLTAVAKDAGAILRRAGRPRLEVDLPALEVEGDTAKVPEEAPS